MGLEQWGATKIGHEGSTVETTRTGEGGEKLPPASAAVEETASLVRVSPLHLTFTPGLAGQEVEW